MLGVPMNEALLRRALADRLEGEEAEQEARRWERDMHYVLLPARRTMSRWWSRVCSRGSRYCPHTPPCGHGP